MEMDRDRGIEEEEDEDVVLSLQPLGEVIFVSGEGEDERNHYRSFEFNGETYRIEDTVLCKAEQENKKPYVAVIKEITETVEHDLMLTVQWFYRPEDAITRSGAYKPRFSRELLYSSHMDEVPADSVMHECVVHFIPLNKQVPERLKHPGFVVQRVYDFKCNKYYSLTDRDYEDNLQLEIDLLVQKTHERLGNLPDLEPEATAGNRETKIKRKPLYRRRGKSPLHVSLVDEGVQEFGPPSVETPGSTSAISSDCNSLLVTYKLLTRDERRNKWLVRLLESIHSKGTSLASVSAVVDLEKAVHNAFSGDLKKYNSKMRSLAFNLKMNTELAHRLLNMELEPEQLVQMSHSELKAALTADEMKSGEPEELNRVQMTDAKCKRCSEKKVALYCIVQAGGRNCYKLQCTGCGNEFYADVGTVTIIGPPTSSTT